MDANDRAYDPADFIDVVTEYDRDRYRFDHRDPDDYLVQTDGDSWEEVAYFPTRHYREAIEEFAVLLDAPGGGDSQVEDPNVAALLETLETDGDGDVEMEKTGGYTRPD